MLFKIIFCGILSGEGKTLNTLLYIAFHSLLLNIYYSSIFETIAEDFKAATKSAILLLIVFNLSSTVVIRVSISSILESATVSVIGVLTPSSETWNLVAVLFDFSDSYWLVEANYIPKK